MFCVMNIQKRKRNDISGIQKEATRTATEYNNQVKPGMNAFNVNLIQSNDWMQDIQDEINRAGAKTRSNSVVALDAIYTASGEFFKGKSTEECNKYFQDCLQFHQKKFGHVISAVVHYDETTPHLHILSVPLTQDGRLSAREIIGNRTNLSRMQTEFFEQVGKGYGLERGIQMDGQEKKKRITAQEHKLRQVKQAKAREEEELEAIKHSKTTARERATRAREQAEQQQEKNRTLKVVESEIRDKVEREQEKAKQLAEMNQKARQELRKTQKQLEHLKGYLNKAEQQRLQEELELQEQDGFELE
jgi:hypothetical protein